MYKSRHEMDKEMFKGCKSLESIGLSSINTLNVVNMTKIIKNE